jgi:hypothetical protein
MRLSKTVADHFREVADRYAQVTGETTYVIADVVDWARDCGQLELCEEGIREALMHRMSEALRSHTARDALGRKIRLRHCVEYRGNGDGTQRTLWAHIKDAPDSFLLESLWQRHKRVEADVESLRADLDNINARRVERGLRMIQMSFDFNSRPSEPPTEN